jgi:fructose-1,6-bisphosphatase/inositol monophosphatase family enzyme
MQEERADGAEMAKAAASVAVEVGTAIKNGTLTDKKSAEDGVEKDDPTVGHHAIVTKEDQAAQTIILKKLATAFPEAFFLTEEKQKDDPTDGRILNDANLELIEARNTFVVDPLDGSSFRNRRLPGWSVSIGVMANGEHVGGAIYAPDEPGELLVAGDRYQGPCISDGSGNFRNPEIVVRERKKSVVFVGLDIHFLWQFSSFVSEFSSQVQTVSSTTCALGLTYLCAGKIDALVQPVQCPWDWAAGYPLVVQAGGKFQFYHYRNGFPEPLEKPDLASYSPTQRNTAFIAGNPEIVDWLFAKLQESWVGQDQFDIVEKFFGLLRNPDGEYRLRNVFAELEN